MWRHISSFENKMSEKLCYEEKPESAEAKRSWAESQQSLERFMVSPEGAQRPHRGSDSRGLKNEWPNEINP